MDNNECISFKENDFTTSDDRVLTFPVGSQDKTLPLMLTEEEKNKKVYQGMMIFDENAPAGTEDGGPYFKMKMSIGEHFRCGKLPIFFDYNNGTRVVNMSPDKEYYCRLTEIDTNTVLGVDLLKADGGATETLKKWYMPTRIEIFEKETWETYCSTATAGESDKNGKLRVDPIFRHNFDMTGKKVIVQSHVPTLGDTFAWFSHMVTFRKEHPEIGEFAVLLMDRHRKIFEKQYDEKFIKFVSMDDIAEYSEDAYATFYLSLFDEDTCNHQPVDHRFAGIHETAGWILGNYDLEYHKPLLDLSGNSGIEEPYVCIAVQSTSLAKLWHHSTGWYDVVRFLKKLGYRVLCVDKQPIYGMDIFWNKIPYGAEDFTGPKSLQERIDLIKDCDFYIGLSSGLAWLADACNVPVVMISGFTHPRNEFYTPYRVWNASALCNSCWNDMRVKFDPNDFMWCPHHSNDKLRYCCSKVISPTQVIHKIMTIPACKKMIEKWHNEHPGEILWDEDRVNDFDHT